MKKINIEHMSKKEILQLLESSNISEEELRIIKERLLSIKINNKDPEWDKFELSNNCDENTKITYVYEVILAGCKDYKLLKEEIRNINNTKEKKALESYLKFIMLYELIILFDNDYSENRENREKFPTIIGRPYEKITDHQIYTVFPATFNGLKEVHEYLTNNPKINSYVFYKLQSKGKDPYCKESYEDVLNELVDNEESIPGNQEKDIFNDKINLYVNIGYNSNITTNQAENYTKFLLLVINRLKEQGYKVNIVGTTVQKMQDEIIDITINLNDKNIQELCKITSTLNFMRRILYRIIETVDVKNELWVYTYGTPLDDTELKEIKGLTDNDLFIPGPSSLEIEGNNLVEDIERANNNLDLDKYLKKATKSPYKK